MLIHDLHNYKDKRHNLLSTQLGENYLKRSCREIENLLTTEVIKSKLINYQKGFEALEFQKFQYEDYKIFHLDS